MRSNRRIGKWASRDTLGINLLKDQGISYNHNLWKAPSPRDPLEREFFPQIGGGVHDIPSDVPLQSPQQEARASTQPPEHLISLPEAPFQREFTPDENEQRPEEPLDGTMDWFQQEEPVRRRPPRQLRSRTIGQVKWDSTCGVRVYDVETGVIQDEIQEPTLGKGQRSWYGIKVGKRCPDHLLTLLHDPRPISEEGIDFEMEDELILPSETFGCDRDYSRRSCGATDYITRRSRCGTWTGSFAVLSQYLITKMDNLERQFQKWYTTLILGLGKHLDQVNSSIEAIYQMGLTKREAKRETYHAQQTNVRVEENQRMTKLRWITIEPMDVLDLPK